MQNAACAIVFVPDIRSFVDERSHENHQKIDITFIFALCTEALGQSRYMCAQKHRNIT